MTFSCWLVISLSVFAASAQPAGYDRAPVLAVIVHKSNPVENLSRAQLRKLLLGEVRQWQDGRKVVLVERDEGSVIFVQMLARVLSMKPFEYKRHLLAVEFQGSQPPIVKTLNSDDGSTKFVWNVPDAIGLIEAVPSSSARANVKVLRIDGKLPGEPGYGL